MAITAPPARPLTFDAAVSLLSPSPSSLVVDCNVDRLVVYVIILHQTAIPMLKEPRVHAIVVHAWGIVLDSPSLWGIVVSSPSSWGIVLGLPLS